MTTGEEQIETKTDMKSPVTFRLVLAVLSSSLASLSMGAVLGWSSPAFPALENENSRIRINRGSSEESWIGSLVNLGGIVGCLFSGFLTDRFGRRLAIIFICAPFIAGWGVIIGAQYVWMLYLGRILTGIACGVVVSAVPVYIAEISPPEVRGMLGSFFQISITFGILLLYAAGIALDWIWLAVLGAIFPAVCAVLMFFMPESPYWLTQRNRPEETRKVLVFLRGREADIDTEVATIEATVTPSDGGGSRIADFFHKETLIPVVISIILLVFLQCSGINAVLFYAENIFISAGSAMQPNVSATLVAGVQVIATVVSCVLVDRIGRRILLLVSAGMMAISLGGLGVYYKLETSVHQLPNVTYFARHYISKDSVSSDLSWIPLTTLILYVVAFSIGNGPVPWIMMSEIIPTKVKSKALSLATIVNFTCSFFVTYAFNPIISNIHEYGIFWMYTGVLIVNFVIVLFIVPETKGKSFEAIDRYFKEGNFVYLFSRKKLQKS